MEFSVFKFELCAVLNPSLIGEVIWWRQKVCFLPFVCLFNRLWIFAEIVFLIWSPGWFSWKSQICAKSICSSWFSKLSACTSDWARQRSLVLDLSQSTYHSDVNGLAPSLVLLSSAGFPGAVGRARPLGCSAEAAALSVTLTLVTDLLHSAAVMGNSW